MPEAASTLTIYGPLGVITIILLWLFIQKDRELAKERAARISDAQGYTQLALSLQKQVLDTSTKLVETFEALRKEDDARKRLR